MKTACLITALFFLAPATALAAKWALDPANSSISFSVGQSGDVVRGSIPIKGAKICFDERDLGGTRADFTFDMARASSGVAERDAIMAAPEWLDSARRPEGAFKLGTFTRLGPNTYQADGDLTIKGKTKTVSVPVTLNLVDDTAKGTLTIDRRDFTIGEGRWGETEEWVDFPIRITFSLAANPTGEPCDDTR